MALADSFCLSLFHKPYETEEIFGHALCTTGGKLIMVTAVTMIATWRR